MNLLENVAKNELVENGHRCQIEVLETDKKNLESALCDER
jgi:hypothetical protein